MATKTVLVRQRGTLTIPQEIRDKYGLADGDPLTVVDLDGAILLTPKVLLVPRLAEELSLLRRSRRLSLRDLGGPARED
jgi:AbrB family looped-hinge helix DNA binding protein